MKCSVNVFKYAFNTPTWRLHCAFTFTSCLKSLKFCYSLDGCLHFVLGYEFNLAHACHPLESQEYLGAFPNLYRYVIPQLFLSGSVSLFLALLQGSCYIKQLQLFLKMGLFAEWGVSGQIKTSSENKAFQWGTKPVKPWQFPVMGLMGELQPTSQATKLLGFIAAIVTRLFLFKSTLELRKSG